MLTEQILTCERNVIIVAVAVVTAGHKVNSTVMLCFQ